MQNQATPTYRFWGTDRIAYGPVELPGLVGWIKQGRVRADTWIFLDEAGTWVRAGELKELKLFFDKREKQAPDAGAAQKPEQLRRIKLFAEMSAAHLTSLLGYVEPVSVRQFSVIFRKGDPGDAMYSVLDGEVRARELAGERETTLFTLGTGESFGELALLIEGERASDIVANEDSSLLRLPATAFRQIIREAPALATPFLLAISRSLAHRSRALGDRLTHDLTLAHVAGSITA